MICQGTGRVQATVCQCGAVLFDPFRQTADTGGPMLQAFDDEATISGGFIQRRLPPEYPAKCLMEDMRISPCEPQVDWLPLVRKQLGAIAALPEGWDSYGGASPDPRFVRAAQSLIECLAQAGDLPQPHVNPTRNGGVQFEWEAGDRYFELELVGERAATYYWRDYSTADQQEGTVFKGDPLDQVLKYIRRVVA